MLEQQIIYETEPRIVERLAHERFVSFNATHLHTGAQASVELGMIDGALAIKKVAGEQLTQSQKTDMHIAMDAYRLLLERENINTPINFGTRVNGGVETIDEMV